MRVAFELTFLAAGVLAFLLAGAGLVVMRHALDRLHYLAYGSLLAPPFFAVAACLHQGWSPASAKVLLIAAVVVVQAPVTTHALGRAIYRAEIQPRRTRGGRV